MRTIKKFHIVTLCLVLTSIATFLVVTHIKPTTHVNQLPVDMRHLTDSIIKIESAYPGEIGVAIIINNTDTVVVNNENKYPMMSVFKLHQAIALCHEFDKTGQSLDSVIRFSRDRLDPHTWSPMLKEHSEPTISLSIKDLLLHTLTQSDNNASNLMFKELVNIAETDSIIATIIPRSSFRISYMEEEMSADHDKAYSNRTSPLGAAVLINRLFTDSILSRKNQTFVTNTLQECKTGKDRIAAPLLNKQGVKIAHKTGSGYTDKNGVLTVHNDVAFIILPDGTHYALAVFVKDFHGNETNAARAIAHISSAVYTILSRH